MNVAPKLNTGEKGCCWDIMMSNSNVTPVLQPVRLEPHDSGAHCSFSGIPLFLLRAVASDHRGPRPQTHQHTTASTPKPTTARANSKQLASKQGWDLLVKLHRRLMSSSLPQWTSKTTLQQGPLCKYWEVEVQHRYYVSIHWVGVTFLKVMGI